VPTKREEKMNGQEPEGGAADYREWQDMFPIFAAGVDVFGVFLATATDSDTVRESDR
jgi:hypothetical protein